jgi:delta 1-pyrroline-5-carboxylate dehydrogenase
MVGVYLFGGFNMSGTDSKAGGPDYLLLVYAGPEHRRTPVSTKFK